MQGYVFVMFHLFILFIRFHCPEITCAEHAGSGKHTEHIKITILNDLRRLLQNPSGSEPERNLPVYGLQVLPS